MHCAYSTEILLTKWLEVTILELICCLKHGNTKFFSKTDFTETSGMSVNNKFQEGWSLETLVEIEHMPPGKKPLSTR